MLLLVLEDFFGNVVIVEATVGAVVVVVVVMFKNASNGFSILAVAAATVDVLEVFVVVLVEVDFSPSVWT